jgi:hypothetical protein
MAGTSGVTGVPTGETSCIFSGVLAAPHLVPGVVGPAPGAVKFMIISFYIVGYNTPIIIIITITVMIAASLIQVHISTSFRLKRTADHMRTSAVLPDDPYRKQCGPVGTLYDTKPTATSL